MTAISKEVITGEDLLQVDKPNQNFLCSSSENALFIGDPNGNPTEGIFSNTYHPTESDNVDWNSVKINLTLQDQGTTNAFSLIFTLYGVMNDSQQQQIGQQVITTCPTTLTTETIPFDLSASSGLPPLQKISSGTAPTGTIQMQLPAMWQNFQSATLNRLWLSGWNKKVTIPITGSTDGAYTPAVIGPLIVPYNSNMNTDFSDLRYYIWDGANLQRCCYGFYSKTNSSTAQVYVLIPNLPGSPAVTNLYRFYGNSGATSTANMFNIMTLFDDFEDGLYTGRNSPYRNWTVVSGTPTIINSGQISGSYSLKHAGQGSGTSVSVAGLTLPLNLTNYTCEFDFKLLTQGSGTNTPYITLFYPRYIDSNNWLRIDTYWDGSSQQVLRLIRNLGGSLAVIATAKWASNKFPTSYTYPFKIADNGNHMRVWGNNILLIDTDYSTSVATGNIGFGALQDSVGIWDNFRIYPYMKTPVNIGTAGNEESTQQLTPTNPQPTDTSLSFPVPSDWSALSPTNLQAQEYTNKTYTTPAIPVSSLDTLFLGYDGVGSYDALGVTTDIIGDNMIYCRVNSLECDYEVIN